MFYFVGLKVIHHSGADSLYNMTFTATNSHSVVERPLELPKLDFNINRRFEEAHDRLKQDGKF